MKYKNLVYLSFANPLSALAAIDSLPPGTEVLEFGQLHSGHMTALIATESNFLLGGVADATDGVFIEAPHADLLKGYLKQKNTRVNKNLLALQATKLSHILTTVDGLLKNTSYQLIEISRATGSHAFATAYLANGKAEDALLPADTDLHIRLFEEPSEELLKLFNV